ncbi:MAG TPA: Maf family protein [Sandaracinaceae bacterium LLY-WYZ-13_1]|nr:Maf family protein [Sandaracinaceae bacterium LLY-WYZ-13_1]
MSGLVLASGSPRRRAILETLGLRFMVCPSAAEERARPGEAPEAMARRLAGEKALEVARRGEIERRAFVLGADTLVIVDGAILGKPADDADARAMLDRLSDRWHEVTTGVALAREGEAGDVLASIAVTTRVRFRRLDPARRDRYVATGEGRDKAGGYAVQGIGMGLVERLEGSCSNVVGLPAAETIDLLERHGALESWP